MTPQNELFHADRLDDELDALAQTMDQPPTTPSQRAYRALSLFYATQAEQEAHTLERVRQRLVATAASAAPRAPIAPFAAGAAPAQQPRRPRRASRRQALTRGIAAVLIVGAVLGGFGALLHARQDAVPLTGYHVHVIPSPNTSLAVNTLTGITVRSGTDAWAWGVANVAPDNINSNPITQPLIEHWDGQHWRIVANPPTPEGGQITDIVALAVDDAWAVGQQLTGGAENTSNAPLVEHWNGRQWTLVEDNISYWPNGSSLNKLAALSADDIWAVGEGGGDTQLGLIQHWDGRSWQTVAHPSPPGSERFIAIAALAPNDIWVVGTGGQVFEHWDGSQWSVFPAPSPSSFGVLPSRATLNAISAVSADDIWAAGSANNLAGIWVGPLFEHWDGHRWSIVSGPSVNGTVSDVVALGPDDVWAVGTTTAAFSLNFDVAQQGQGLVEHWDGQRWSVIANPTPRPFTSLGGVAADPSNPGKVWIAGITGPALGPDQLTDTQTLIETNE